ncbi:type 1 glutamine amidotransferase [Pseudoruegeria sp. HB172150]|uniref:type 1 glutamine amidotransferase n=1 Tax=Pseudoruegeria sp. HB172150 TaxID=2721164 RepID=UPI00155449CA|nr:type 1 glutamine amidotransferase [Pseudoruegeria sp. HB172150]
MHIGILQTGHAPEALVDQFGEYPAMFEQLLSGNDFTFDTYPVEDMVLPGSIHAADGWLITGSKHGAYEDHPWIPPLEQFIRNCYGAEVPLVGICFGHQIIAQALGGHVEKFKGGWSVGRKLYDFDGIGDLAVHAWHQDQVTALPSDAKVVASNDFCANAALVYDNRAFTVQPHPEYGAGFIEGLITHRGPGVVPDAQLAAARESLAAPVDQPKLADMIARFFKERRYA